MAKDLATPIPNTQKTIPPHTQRTHAYAAQSNEILGLWAPKVQTFPSIFLNFVAFLRLSTSSVTAHVASCLCNVGGSLLCKFGKCNQTKGELKTHNGFAFEDLFLVYKTICLYRIRI